MKNTFFLLALTTLVNLALAQTNNFSIREEVVKPPMTIKFREAMKKLKTACEEAKLNFSWTTLALDDNTYSFIAPLNSMSDLDKNPFAGLETKFGKEGAAKIWA